MVICHEILEKWSCPGNFVEDLEVKKGKWNINVKFHPTLHAIIRGPSRRTNERIPKRLKVRKGANDKLVILSTYEIIQICQDERKIRFYTKIPEYLRQDLLKILHLALEKFLN